MAALSPSVKRVLSDRNSADNAVVNTQPRPGADGKSLLDDKHAPASGEWHIRHAEHEGGTLSDAEFRKKFGAWREKFEKLVERPADSIGPEERESGGKRFSIQAFADGTQFVHVDVEQEAFQAAKEKDYPKVARRIILKRFRGKVIGGEPPKNAYVKTSTAGEFAYPSKPLPKEENTAKMRSAGELDNLLAIGEFAGHKPDDGHHPEATGGWDYYNTIFEVGGRFFAGKVNLLVNNRGRVFHDVTDIEENTQGLMDQHGEPRAQFPAHDANTQPYPGADGKSEGRKNGPAAEREKRRGRQRSHPRLPFRPLRKDGKRAFNKVTGNLTFKWESPEGVTFTIGAYTKGKGKKARQVVNTVYTDRNWHQTKMLGTNVRGQVRNSQPSGANLPLGVTKGKWKKRHSVSPARLALRAGYSLWDEREGMTIGNIRLVGLAATFCPPRACFPGSAALSSPGKKLSLPMGIFGDSRE